MEETKEEVWAYKITAQELIAKLGLKGTDVESIEEDEDEDFFVIRTTIEEASPQESAAQPQQTQPAPTQNY
jgi:DNA-binding GntR family transcriptional regulator